LDSFVKSVEFGVEVHAALELKLIGGPHVVKEMEAKVALHLRGAIPRKKAVVLGCARPTCTPVNVNRPSLAWASASPEVLGHEFEEVVQRGDMRWLERVVVNIEVDQQNISLVWC